MSERRAYGIKTMKINDKMKGESVFKVDTIGVIRAELKRTITIIVSMKREQVRATEL